MDLSPVQQYGAMAFYMAYYRPDLFSQPPSQRLPQIVDTIQPPLPPSTPPSLLGSLFRLLGKLFCLS